MSVNSWSYLFVLLIIGFVHSFPQLRRRKLYFVIAINFSIYFIVDSSLLPACFFFSVLSYFFALLVKDSKFSSGSMIGILMSILFSGGLFMIGKLIPDYKVNPDITSRILIPLGFSYVMLQNIAFVIDAKNNKNHFPSFLEFVASSMFFANILSGPIADLYQVRQNILANRITEEDIRDGFLRIVNGFFKKTVSDLVSVTFLFPVANSAYISAGNLVLVPALLLKFYLDFSGYTDMAVGGARLLGVHLPENFDRPYSSITMADYWNRWHMTLGGWFKKYFFYPLQIKIFRTLKVSENFQVVLVNFVLFVTFVAIGLWHGLTMKFFIWGIFNASFVLLSNWMIRLKVHLPARIGFLIFNWLTLLLIFVGQVLLLSESTASFAKNLSEILMPSKNPPLIVASAFVVAAILFAQHKLDGLIKDGFFKINRRFIALVFFQILIAIFFHKSGGTFLYAEF